LIVSLIITVVEECGAQLFVFDGGSTPVAVAAGPDAYTGICVMGERLSMDVVLPP
jgi:hypothetical protein